MDCSAYRAIIVFLLRFVVNERFKNICLMTASIIFCAALAEAVARVALGFSPGTEINFLSQDRIVPGLTLGRPNSVQRQRYNRGDFDVTVNFNRYGLRDPEDVSRARPDDLLIVGDSFAFGHGVEEMDRFSSLLRDDHQLRVFNVAVPTHLSGYRALLAYARKIGSKSNKLILVICMENDLVKKDGDGDSSISLPGDKRIPLVQSASALKPYLKSLKLYLVQNSALYYLVTSVVHGSPAVASVFGKVGLVDSYMSDYSIKMLPVDIDLSAKTVASIIRGYDATIVLVPNRFEWLKDDSGASSYFRSVHEQFSSKLGELGLNVIDLRPIFNQSSDPLAEFHFPNDGHWNRKGHRLAADALWSALQVGSLSKN